MRTRDIGTGLIAVCLWLGGHPAAEGADPVAAEERQTTTDHGASDRPSPKTEAVPTETEEPARKIEVLDEGNWPGGELRLRQEGYRDAEGNPVPHGPTIQWWENGQKRNEVTFVDGVRHGSRLAWYRNGAKWSEGAYDHGKSAGTWTVWFVDGTLQQRQHYDENGGFHGVYTMWHPNGQKKIEFEFVHGRKQGFETVWNEEGTIRLEVDFGRDEQ